MLCAVLIQHVAQPLLLVQDLTSWTRDGIAGLQSVVLYSLPELDGAIDTVPLGGLMGNNIFLVPERVKRLSARLRKWVSLRRTPKHVRTAPWPAEIRHADVYQRLCRDICSALSIAGEVWTPNTFCSPLHEGASDCAPPAGLALRISCCAQQVFACMQERKVAVLLYGFPPGVGATGTAALLNVPKSLEKLLEELQQQGYDLGEAGQPGSAISGEAIINALRMQEDQRSISGGAAGIEKA